MPAPEKDSLGHPEKNRTRKDWPAEAKLLGKIGHRLFGNLRHGDSNCITGSCYEIEIVADRHNAPQLMSSSTGAAAIGVFVVLRAALRC